MTDSTKLGPSPENLPRFDSPLHLWIAIWQRQLVQQAA